ncbi:MAG TPA: DUF72 domain-containing protein [Geobacteraceae bacterium]|nr:DUF72 domain-containing protein [Geobacteraceae bacterium]
MKFHVGTSGYGYKEWKGVFYPEKISPKEMLRFYGERLTAVEINYTFYHMPTERILASWAEQVPDGFAFALKAPQVVTHLKQLRNVGEEADYFFRTAAVLGEKLGAVLFQFPKSFRADLPVLEDFLRLIPRGVHCAFEFRSPTWLAAGMPDLLRDRGHSLCTADTDEKPAQEIVGTAPWGYLRLRRTDYTDADLAQWLERMGAQRWERAFVFFKHEEEGAEPMTGPDVALRFRALAEAGGRKSGKRG